MIPACPAGRRVSGRRSLRGSRAAPVTAAMRSAGRDVEGTAAEGSTRRTGVIRTRDTARDGVRETSAGDGPRVETETSPAGRARPRSGPEIEAGPGRRAEAGSRIERNAGLETGIGTGREIESGTGTDTVPGTRDGPGSGAVGAGTAPGRGPGPGRGRGTGGATAAGRLTTVRWARAPIVIGAAAAGRQGKRRHAGRQGRQGTGDAR